MWGLHNPLGLWSLVQRNVPVLKHTHAYTHARTHTQSARKPVINGKWTFSLVLETQGMVISVAKWRMHVPTKAEAETQLQKTSIMWECSPYIVSSPVCQEKQKSRFFYAYPLVFSRLEATWYEPTEQTRKPNPAHCQSETSCIHCVFILSTMKEWGNTMVVCKIKKNWRKVFLFA